MADAPQTRVNITMKNFTGGEEPEIELPLRQFVMGDFTGRPDETPLEERRPAEIKTAGDLEEVLRAKQVCLTAQVKNEISGTNNPEDQIAINLKFNSMRDFEPDELAKQVPELRELLELRDALTQLKGPLSNNKAWRSQLQALISDESQVRNLLDEIEVGNEKK